jgi:hypothetical protein
MAVGDLVQTTAGTWITTHPVPERHTLGAAKC